MNRRTWIVIATLAAALTAGFFVSTPRRTASAEPGADAETPTYQCAMHPQIVAHEPGSCPICGMALERVDAASHGGAEHAAPPPASDVPGRAAFTLPLDRRQRIGVRTARVEPRALTRTIRTVGTVAYDRELYQALVEYREAIASKRELASAPLPDAARGADAIVRGAKLKLRQLGLSDASLAANPEELLLPGANVWVYTRIFESEADLVKVGVPLSFTSPSAPGRRFTATVDAIDSVLDESTRTIRVRSRVASAGASLRPGGFLDVEIAVPLGSALALPHEAILDTGEVTFAFVVDANGRFDPRLLHLGREADGAREVLHGVAAGDEVVTSANFLIDSESRARAAVSAFSSGAVHVH
jgi:membrane fusion protein, copper/silver efflux system